VSLVAICRRTIQILLSIALAAFAPPGSFVPTSASWRTIPCQAGSISELAGATRCTVCPANADCGSLGSALALSGYFRRRNQSFGRCRVPTACVGENRCANGAVMPELGCYPCAHGWARPGSGSLQDKAACSQCPSSEALYVYAALAILAGVALAVYMAHLNIVGARRFTCLHPYVLKIGLSHIMMMSGFAGLEKWELEPGFTYMSSFLRDILAVVFAWDGMFPTQALRLDCLLQVDGMSGAATARMWRAFALWVSFPLGFILLCLLLCFTLVEVHRLAHIASRFVRRDKAEDLVERKPGGLDAVVPVPRDTTSDPTKVPAGWEAIWSKEHNQFYYYNPDGDISTWVQPKFEGRVSHAVASMLSTGGLDLVHLHLPG